MKKQRFFCGTRRKSEPSKAMTWKDFFGVQVGLLMIVPGAPTMGFTSWGPRGPKEDSTAPMRSGCPGGSYGWEGTAASCGATIGGQGALDPWGTGISWGFHGDFMGTKVKILISWGQNGEESLMNEYESSSKMVVYNLYTIIWWG